MREQRVGRDTLDFLLRFVAPSALVALALMYAGCGNSNKISSVVADTPIEQRYLFDVYVVNAAWGYQLRGVYIDKQGLVVRYDHSFERWVADDYGRLTEAELDEKYIAPTDTLASIDQAVLFERFGQIEAARVGELSDRVPAGNDMGGGSYVCYAYDNETETYERVLLSLSGDFTQTNLAPEAVELTNWLRSVLASVVGQ